MYTRAKSKGRLANTRTHIVLCIRRCAPVHENLQRIVVARVRDDVQRRVALPSAQHTKAEQHKAPAAGVATEQWRELMETSKEKQHASRAPKACMQAYRHTGTQARTHV